MRTNSDLSAQLTALALLIELKAGRGPRREWIHGAIFTLSWILEEPGSLSPITALGVPWPMLPARSYRPASKPPGEGEQYCDQCDGVGWTPTAGGNAVGASTACSKCRGTGVLGRKT
jgi:hypothetical protein